MKLVLFTHYSLFASASMPRFAKMVAEGIQARGHEVVEWPCPVVLANRVRNPFVAKWLGYIDQFILFPRLVKQRLRSEPHDTLFVVTDHALGPWVPLIADRPHVIHCHDLLAQRSALGEFPENPTGTTGKLYQAFIRRGYRQGRNFISVSKKTREDLHRFLDCKPVVSEVVYNGLNYPFTPLPADEAIARLRCIPELRDIVASQENDTAYRQDACATLDSPPTETLLPSNFPTSSASPSFILHVGGNQWYKNREGVLLAYREYSKRESSPVPLVMIGKEPQQKLRSLTSEIPNDGKVFFISSATNEQVHAAYSLASLLFYPSLEEGFGWPIAEAMACGCPVITTDQAPMTEVGANAAFYIPRRNAGEPKDTEWAGSAADAIQQVLNLSREGRKTRIQLGLKNVERFNAEQTIDAYEKIYQQVLENHSSASSSNE